MNCVENLAAFVGRSSYEDLSETASEQLKSRIVDSEGCAVGAIEGEPVAAAEYADPMGQDLMTALATAYRVQCRLGDVAPVREQGFDHTTQGWYSAAAGVSKAFGLDEIRTGNALGICGATFNALRVTRTGQLSPWKGIAFPKTAACFTRVAFLATRGITVPLGVFEGDKGFMDAISGVLDLKRRHRFSAAGVERIEIETFDVAFNTIGGGDEGEKTNTVTTKEQADHSLPYVTAVAIPDGDVMPAQ